jgi:hypothetical protein
MRTVEDRTELVFRIKDEMTGRAKALVFKDEDGLFIVTGGVADVVVDDEKLARQVATLNACGTVVPVQ